MTVINTEATGRVTLDGLSYAAEPVAGGAAYELFSEAPAPGFIRLSSLGRWAYHRFVHAGELGLAGQATQPESVLHAPLSRATSWEQVQRLSQMPPREQLSAHLIASVRQTATIRRGTRMIKPLTAAGVTGMLHGQLPHGFCYREWDVAHLRTPAELSVFTHEPSEDHAFALRWRAVDPSDYRIPTSDLVAGLTAMPPHDRVGAAVLGTGFAPSSYELIPEWITADLGDLPLPAHAALIAYAPDGTEVVLYTYQPEQRGWLRLVGPQWRHLLAPIRDISADQEYVPLNRNLVPSTRLVGTFRGEEFEAVADPPEFRVLAMTRAARYPVETLFRRTRYARWRGSLGTVLAADANWVRLRLCQPDPASVVAMGAQCYERGIYEAWAPATEITEAQEVVQSYEV